MNAYEKLRKALNTGDSCDLLTAMDALAELEKAVAERDELRSEHGPRVTQLFEAIAERDQLRAELVVVVAERDERIAKLELQLRISRQSNKDLRESAERAEARLAAIDNAPTAAVVLCDEGREHVEMCAGDSLPHGTELIAKPAKGTACDHFTL